MQTNVTCQNTDCCLSTEYGGSERQKERVTKDTEETFGCNGYVIILIVVRFHKCIYQNLSNWAPELACGPKYSLLEATLPGSCYLAISNIQSNKPFFPNR